MQNCVFQGKNWSVFWPRPPSDSLPGGYLKGGRAPLGHRRKFWLLLGWKVSLWSTRLVRFA